MSNEFIETSIKETWNKVFPNSSITVRNGGYGTLYCNAYLAKDKTEFANGISQNDPLNYSFCISSFVYSEMCCSIGNLKPNDKFHVYSSLSIRKKTIKNIDVTKLENRFKQVKEELIKVKDSMINLSFDINSKIID